MRYILENILGKFCDGIKLLFEPFLFLKTYFAPGGCFFTAYDYETEKKEVDGKQVILFVEEKSFPHFALHEDDVVLPVKSQVDEEGFPFVYTEYTSRNFFVDTKNNILYVKEADLAFFGEPLSATFYSEYVNKKRRDDYYAEALGYLNNVQRT